MKREEKLFDAITDVRDDLVEDALEHRFARRAPAWQRYGSLAACLVLLVGAVTCFRIFGSKGGSDAAKNEAASDCLSDAGDMLADDSKTENTAGGGSLKEEPADDSDGMHELLPGTYRAHAGLLLPMSFEDGMDVSVERELRLNVGELLQVKDIYFVTAAKEQTVELHYPVTADGFAFGGVVVTVNGEEVKQKLAHIDAGLEQADPSAMSHADRKETDEDGCMIIWSLAELTLPAGEMLELCVSYEKSVPASVEIVLSGEGLTDGGQRVILNGKEIAISNEGVITLDID